MNDFLTLQERALLKITEHPLISQTLKSLYKFLKSSNEPGIEVYKNSKNFWIYAIKRTLYESYLADIHYNLPDKLWLKMIKGYLLGLNYKFSASLNYDNLDNNNLRPLKLSPHYSWIENLRREMRIESVEVSIPGILQPKETKGLIFKIRFNAPWMERLNINGCIFSGDNYKTDLDRIYNYASMQLIDILRNKLKITSFIIPTVDDYRNNENNQNFISSRIYLNSEKGRAIVEIINTVGFWYSKPEEIIELFAWRSEIINDYITISGIPIFLLSIQQDISVDIEIFKCSLMY